MDKFLDTYDHPKPNQEDINYLNRSTTWNEIEDAIKGLPKKKSPGPDRVSAEFYLIFKLFHEIEKERILPNTFYEATPWNQIKTHPKRRIISQSP
jgi:hypothetical protein